EVGGLVADEARADGVIVGDVAEPVAGPGRQQRPVLGSVGRGGEPARDLRCRLAEGGDGMRVEGHDRDRPGVTLERPGNRAFERADGRAHVAVLVLDLDEDRHAAGDERQHLLQRRDAVVAVEEAERPEFRGGEAADASGNAGEPPQVVVVKDHRDAVGRGLDVAFDAISRVDRRTEGGGRILRPSRLAVVQLPVRDGRMEEGRRQRNGAGWGAARGGHHATWNTASISTATPSGRAGAETAARAWRPASPKTATMRSEQPLITLGWSVKSGVEFTKPPSFTTRTIRSRSPPRAARAWARRLRPQRRAASEPSATSIVSPSRPLIRPAGPCEIWPETKRRSPA